LKPEWWGAPLIQGSPGLRKLVIIDGGGDYDDYNNKRNIFTIASSDKFLCIWVSILGPPTHKLNVLNYDLHLILLLDYKLPFHKCNINTTKLLD